MEKGSLVLLLAVALACPIMMGIMMLSMRNNHKTKGKEDTKSEKQN